MESAPEKQSWRRESIDSLASDGSFVGEMDQFIDDVLKRKQIITDDSPSNKETEEDNISEEKVKLELQENEKGPAKKNKESDAWSSDSEDRWSSPEPEDDTIKDISDANIGKESETEGFSENMGSQREPIERSPSRQESSFDDEDGEIEELNMSEDQQKALGELQQFKLDLHKARYTDEEPPEYDVAERVRQLNQELANSPTPADDERARSIKFKDNLVDLVAPPPDYPSDEEVLGPAKNSPPPSTVSQSGKNRGDGDTSVNDLRMSRMNLYDSEEGTGDGPNVSSNRDDFDGPITNGISEEGGREPPAPAPPPPPPVKEPPLEYKKPVKKKVTTSDEQQVLVERDGTFELLNIEDLTAEERSLYLAPPPPESAPATPTTPDSSVSADSSSSGSYVHPTPPRHPRPATASAAQSHRRAVNSATYQRRVQSATPNRATEHSAKFNSNYQSPYAIPQHLKDIGEKRRKEKEDRERQEKQLKRMEDDQKRRENEQAFEGWKKNKRKSGSEYNQGPDQETSDKDKEDGVYIDDDDSSQRSEAAFNEWMKTKRNQMRRERNEADLLKKEEEQMMSERPRQESDKAFRQYVYEEWLKKKNVETKKAKKQDVSRARISKLLVRRTRKAMQLARAIQKSQTFRYVDYYGYRF